MASFGEKIKKKIADVRGMGKNLNPSVPLYQQKNVTLKEYIAMCVTKIGAQMWSIVSTNYGSIFIYECFYASQGYTEADVAPITAILTTVTTVLSYFVGVLTAAVAFRWKGKTGRYRPWYLIGLIPHAVCCVLSFIVPDVGRSGLLVFKFAVAILSVIFSGFYTLSGNMVQVISPNPEEKKNLVTVQQIFYYVGYGLAYILPFVYGKISSDTKTMYLLLAVVSVAILSAGSVMCFCWCKERIEMPKKQKVKITGATIGLFKYKNYVAYHLCSMFSVFSMTGEMVMYLCAVVVGSDNAVVFSLPSAIGTAVGVAACTFLSKKFSPKQILQFVALYCPLTALATFFTVYFSHSYTWWLFFACYFLFGITFGLADMATGHMDIEINDFLEWKKKERLECVQGVIPGWIKSAFSYARGILLPFILLWVGYETNKGSGNLMEYMKTQPNYEKTCLWLLALALFGTALQCLLRGLVLTFMYDIQGEKKERMYRELADIRTKRHEENLADTETVNA